jgi:hypothetical protein
MPGKTINQSQVNLYMSYRNKPKQTQSPAAAKAGLSSRTARILIQGNTPPLYYRVNNHLNGFYTYHLNHLSFSILVILKKAVFPINFENFHFSVPNVTCLEKHRH